MTGLPELPPGMTPDDALALDWALGALDARAHADAEARRMADPAFARLCDEWAGQLAPLADEVLPVEPSAALWQRIEAELADAPVAAPVQAQRTSGWWNNLALWRGATVAFASLAGAVLISRPAPPAPPAPVVVEPGALLAATLASDAGAPLVTAALDRDRRAVVLAPVSTQDLAGRVPELWLIPADGTPRSLGLITLGGTQKIAVSPTMLQLVAEGAVLAVSLEPAGGSPTGLPTGPVVATGKLASI